MNSSAVVPEQRHRSNMAVGYSRIFPDRSRKLMPYTDSKGLTAAANMCSSVEDFGKYIALQFRTNDTSVNQIVKGSTLAEMHRVQWLQPSWKRGWGLGFSVRKTDERVLVGHGGWVAGYKTQILFSPEEKIGMIVLINADDGDPGFFANEMFTIFAGVLRTKPVEMPKAQETDQNLRKFAGTYVDTWGWESEIMLRGNMLVMYDHSYPPEENPLEGIIELTHESGNAFRRTGTNGDGEPVIFELDKNGVVIRVNIGPNYLVPKR
jgi:CubicO group peptidase (beta-lactamase class C family)